MGLENYRNGEKVCWYMAFINALLAIIKGSVGIISGSTALIADALHSASDIGSTIIVILGLKIAQKPADQEHPYGHGRAEVLAAKLLSVLLVFAGIAMLYAGYTKLSSHEPIVPGYIGMVAAGFSILVKEGMYQYTIRVGKSIQSSALIADAWHHRTDAISSIAAFFGIFGALQGYPFLDPLAGIAVSGMIIWIGVKIFICSAHQVMDKQMDDGFAEDIMEVASSIEGVEHVDGVRLRRYGVEIVVDLSLSVDRELVVWKGHEIGQNVKKEIQGSYHIVSDVLIHVNPHPEDI